MSASDATSDEATESASLSEAQYARYDWFGESEDAAASSGAGEQQTHSDHVVGHDPDGNPVTKQKIESVAHGFLKMTSDQPMLDPIALIEDPDKCPYECDTYVETGECDHESYNLHMENQEAPLTDPAVYPPSGEGSLIEPGEMERKAPNTKRWRYCEELGHLSYGGIIPDRPAEKLIGELPLIFDLVCVQVSDRNREKIIHRAGQLKSRGDLHDTEIVRRVARWIYNPNELDDTTE